MSKTLVVWTVKSNSQVGYWEPAKTVRGAMRAARQAACNVTGATCAIVGERDATGRVRETHKLGDYSIAESSKWVEII